MLLYESQVQDFFNSLIQEKNRDTLPRLSKIFSNPMILLHYGVQLGDAQELTPFLYAVQDRNCLPLFFEYIDQFYPDPDYPNNFMKYPIGEAGVSLFDRQRALGSQESAYNGSADRSDEVSRYNSRLFRTPPPVENDHDAIRGLNEMSQSTSFF